MHIYRCCVGRRLENPDRPWSQQTNTLVGQLKLVDGPVQVGLEVLLHTGREDGLAGVRLDVPEWHLDRLVLVERDCGKVLGVSYSI